MIKFIYSKCFDVLREKPSKLWGLSLLGSLLSVIAASASVVPLIGVPLVLTLTAGMAIVYLNGYERKEIGSEQIFAGFKNFLHVAGGMCWMYLWIFIWAMIPIAGIVFAVIKSYSYRFTPYILMTEPEISPMDALKESMKRTEGHKGKMFLADFIAGIIIFAVLFALILLTRVRHIGIVFYILYLIVMLLISAFSPIFYGLLSAAFFKEAPNMPIKVYTQPTYQQPDAQHDTYQQPTYQQPKTEQAEEAPVYNAPEYKPKTGMKVCPKCSAQNLVDAKFCSKCGNKL